MKPSDTIKSSNSQMTFIQLMIFGLIYRISNFDYRERLISAINLLIRMSKRISTNIDFIRELIIEQIIKKAEELIKINVFAQDNLFTYVLDTQQGTLQNVMSQIVFLPQRNNDRNDREACSLYADSLMSVKKLNNEKRIKKQQNRKSQQKIGSKLRIKTQNTPSKSRLNRYKSLVKELEPKYRENGDDGEVISKLRDEKQKQQSERKRNSALIPKKTHNIHRNKRLSYDYQGNISTIAQSKNNKILTQILKVSILNQAKTKQIDKDTLCSHLRQSTIVPQMEKSHRKTEKSHSSFDFQIHQMRQVTINSIKLSNFKNKLVFDGQEITYGMQNHLLDFEPKKQHEESNRLLMSCHTDEKQSSLKGKRIERTQIPRTQSSITNYRHQNSISISNESLKNMLLHQVNNSYVEFPKKVMKSAIKTHTKLINNDLNKAQIHQNSSNMKRFGVLQRILSGNTFKPNNLQQICRKNGF